MQESKVQNTQFKVGQTVWCLLYGEGKVSDVDGFVEVDFGWTAELYTFEGVHIGCTESTMGQRVNRTLFHSEPRVIAETEPVFEPKLVGKVVVVTEKGRPDLKIVMGEVIGETEDTFTIRHGTYYKAAYDIYELKDEPIIFD